MYHLPKNDNFKFVPILKKGKKKMIITNVKIVLLY